MLPQNRLSLIVFFMILAVPVSMGCGLPGASTSRPSAPADTIKVVQIKYFPVKDHRIDISVTGDWGEPLSSTRAKVDSISSVLQAALSEGSRYRGYRVTTALPALVYRVIETYEFLEPLPTFDRPGRETPMTDYDAIMSRIDAQQWVEVYDVKELWIWGYHGGVIDLWESNMSGPHGDISNSDRIESDLPVFDRTYTVYHYNYQRGAAEAMENHMHQLEAVLNYFDGRDEAPNSEWPELLFWGKFVGSDSTHKLVSPIRAGWSHYPPNATRDYEWASTEYVQTDIEDWNPYGSGEQTEMNCERWSCDHLGWFVYWTQNLPGRGSGISYRGRPLRNWWSFLSDTDVAFEESWRLWK